MTAAKKNLYIEQGATFQLSFTWNEGTSDAVGSPVDLTGASARMQLRKNQQSPPIVDAMSAGASPQIMLGGTAGTISITLTPSDTDALALKTALYDLEVEFPDGVVVRLLEGSATISPNITQTQGQVVPQLKVV